MMVDWRVWSRVGVAVVVGWAVGCGGGGGEVPEREAEAAAEPGRTIAVTFDDLPFVGGEAEAARRGTAALLEALEEAGAPASGFVIGRWAEEDEARGALLEEWLDAGHRLENHSRTHPHYNELAIPEYLADVREGHALVASAVEPRGGRVRWFRAPYNDVGDTPEKRAALLEALEGLDVGLAPFTVEHSDWLFEAVYSRALAGGDSARADTIREAYLAQLDTAMAFAERLSLDTFGREIPQVLLLHANRLNAASLPAMLEKLEARGYRFVTMEEATSDSAYATPNEYGERWGVSWLHRWRVGLGLPNRLRGEPGPPEWVMEAYESL
jgi:peptidoglycan/xylan/chitin deacetylase (PgdA/CDA1 family)